jgi:hypothetical protein
LLADFPVCFLLFGQEGWPDFLFWEVYCFEGFLFWEVDFLEERPFFDLGVFASA